MRNLLLSDRQLQDLNPLDAGEEKCLPGKGFGPHVRKYTLIHYVLRGRGTLYARGGAHPVEAGQAFVINPGQTTTYRADLHDPWHYCWIGFNGSLSADFARLPPVLTLPRELFSPLLRSYDGPAEYRLAAMLMALYDRLFAHRQSPNLHVQRVQTYIRANYMLPISIEELSSRLGLNRRYLGRLFKTHTGQTMQEFLLQTRMEAARALLKQGQSVAQVAHQCGYEDASNFSKMYKKSTGKSPTQDRGQ